MLIIFRRVGKRKSTCVYKCLSCQTAVFFISKITLTIITMPLFSYLFPSEAECCEAAQSRQGRNFLRVGRVALGTSCIVLGRKLLVYFGFEFFCFRFCFGVLCPKFFQRVRNGFFSQEIILHFFCVSICQ